ncbi:Apoptosis 2 inhibitor [Dufourea novaeangliae]|uniref:Apoptosis 2 inhibitor n=1 Tax=Dufourea novaeangliae TaxID=178035 RepID=A0A154PIJ1_DUFNO|nr:Apoptosis 2 inhibitor [Dufourea novaeangliae]
MNVEENRLQTFEDWPANAPIDATRLAKAGFYYSGHSLKVQCFLCGVQISDWNYNDRAIVRHREAAPDCPFIRNPFNTCNIPLVPTSTTTEIGSVSDAVERQFISSFIQTKNVGKEYKMVFQRLDTFANWPIPSIVSPEKLAEAGFYYLQHEDRVQCVYCKGIVKKWESGDDPDKEHRKHFPKCDFYLHKDTGDLNTVKLMPGSTSSLTELGIQEHIAPKHPNHATYEGRLRTFYGWPESLKQTPEILASAGFYYTGLRDLVRCFHCDGALRDWETTDDVWTEHARWFSKCEFVNLIRGQKFIQECIDNRPPLLPSIFEGVPEDESSDLTEISSTSLCTVPPSTQEVTETAEEAEEIGTEHVNLNQVMHIQKNVQKMIQKNIQEMILCSSIHCTTFQPFLNNIISTDILYCCTYRHGIITTLYSRIWKQRNNDNEITNTLQEINADKNEIILSQKEEFKISDKKDNAFQEKANVKVEKNGFILCNFSACLEEENRKLKEALLCKICMDREVAIVFLPCGHLATCVHCASSLTYCQMCRQKIQATVRIFLS